MEYYPIFLALKNQRCLIVGGGRIAYRKAVLLNKAHAQIHIIALAIDADLRALAESSGGVCELREFKEADLNNCRIVIAATDDSDLNREISKLAQQKELPVNVVDCPELCTFITPAIVEREPLTIAISSGGAAPVLVRNLKSKIETLVPAAYGRLARLAGSFRDKVKAVVHTEDDRRRFWEKIFTGPVGESVLAGRDAEAELLLEQSLAAEENKSFQGEVYLVGGGPGDPELLTLKALRLMQQCDVVLYDRLVSPEVMELVRRDAERIYVGKRRADHAVPQLEISQMLVDLAGQGKRVLRLKGGDPFIFGRGGEELELLAAHKIPFQVVPGITAASGCAAYTGIPLTHRDHAQSVRFITGHLKDNSMNLNWQELAQPNQTLVFYMGLMGLEVICRSLMEVGRAETTPIALVEKGTTKDQRLLVGTLKTLPKIVAEEDVHAPTLLIIGDVVGLHEQLQWFGRETIQ